MFEEWGILLLAAAAGFAFISPIIGGFATKLLPSASAGTQKIIAAVAGGAGVVVAIVAARHIFGRRIERV